MPRLEASIELSTCAKVLSEFGVQSDKLKTSRNGAPDRLFWLPGGRPLLIEFKRPGEVPEPLQAHRHAQLRLLGYDLEVHDDVDEAVAAVGAALARARQALAATKVPAQKR